MSPRVASFVPSGTEWMYALGLQDRLVGVTSECSVPPEAKMEKPWLVRSRFEGFAASAGATDAAVREALAKDEPLFRLDEDALRGARPDVLLVQSLCDVCGASEAHVPEARRILGYAPEVASTSPSRLDDVWRDAITVATAAGAPQRGHALATQLRQRVERVRSAVARRPRPRVALLEWSEPPMRAGHWLPDVVAAAGAREVLGAPGGKSARVSWEDVASAAPEVILCAPCGYPLARAVAEARPLARRFPDARVFALDAERYLSRSGPNLATMVEILARLFHPAEWPRDADPTAWRQVGP